MNRIALAAAAAIAAALIAPAASAQGPARPVTATWHPAMGTAGRYCIRSTHLETAAMTGTRIYQRTCRTERAWRDRGVTFARPAPRS